MYIKRHIDKELIAWKKAQKHKPLLLRGARQVGKSSSVRELGKTFKNFVEINFEKKEFDLVKDVFIRHSSPNLICNELSAMLGQKIVAGETLLFLDEVQSCIPAIEALRYFYEEMPDLHVIAAGSLLEFALEQVPTFGVGRVRSLFMYPLSFDEFIRAMNFNTLADAVLQAKDKMDFPISLHQKCIEHLKIFLLIGGMPEVVASYIENGSLLECQQILDDLTKTFYDDFAKYKERTSVSQLREVFNAVIQQAGKKFVFSNIQGINQLQVKKGVEMLEMAGLIYPITHTSANGLPLGAEINNKHKKFMLFDCGIYQRYLQLNIAQILSADSFDAINKGAIAELFVATELKKSTPANNSSELYYWRREQQGSQAEVDFVVQDGEDIVPIEVKAGLKGSMQSMFLFLKEKNKKYGIRTSLENFGKFDNIKIYPLYAIACAAGGAS